jgi:hypothetical protein
MEAGGHEVAGRDQQTPSRLSERDPAFSRCPRRVPWSSAATTAKTFDPSPSVSRKHHSGDAMAHERRTSGCRQL